MLYLDWNHAIAGRLSTDNGQTSPLSCEAAAIRLRRELDAGTLPFMDMPYLAHLKSELTRLEPHLRSFKHMILLGIGGSALGARALQRAFYPEQDRPNHTGKCLWIADNIDADTLDAWTRELVPHETIVVTISKSGGTIETLAQYFLLRDWLKQGLGDAWAQHMLIVTDATKGFLRQEVGVHTTASLTVPDHLGGRYSVVSAVGMVPAAFLGLPWQDILDGALVMNAALVAHPDAATLSKHPAWAMAQWAHALGQNNYSQLIFFVYMPLWAGFGAWFGQLWAESLGKDGKGTMPLPALGVTDQHSLQQMFLDGPKDKGCVLLTCERLSKGQTFGQDLPEAWAYLRGKSFGELLTAEGLGTATALSEAAVPLLQISMDGASPRHAGALMALCMAATVFTGWMLDIDPLDQPAVELGKRLANARLGAPGYEAEHAMLNAFLNPMQSVSSTPSTSPQR